MLSDDDVIAICRAEISSSLGFLEGRLAETRLKSLQYYNAEPYGNEIDGSSQIVTTEVRDTVESIMPSLMKIFLSGDKVAQFDPMGPEDEQVADQATDYANYIFTKGEVECSIHSGGTIALPECHCAPVLASHNKTAGYPPAALP